MTFVQTHENLEHLAMMEAVLGPVPEHMARHANRGSAKYFTHRNRLNWPAGAASRKSVRAVQKMRDLRDIIQSGCDASVKPHIDTLVRAARLRIPRHLFWAAPPPAAYVNHTDHHVAGPAYTPPGHCSMLPASVCGISVTIRHPPGWRSTARFWSVMLHNGGPH